MNERGGKSSLVEGLVTIELTNVRTGEKKVIRHHNTFQSAVISKALRSLGAYNNNPFANSNWRARPLWRNLCGGILLFKDAIDLTGGAVEYMPAGNQMTANGSYGVTNASTPTEMGSYNSVESSTSGTSSISFVYDWGTSQGNGTISCICLSSDVGGYIGYGNASGSAASSKAFTADQSSNELAGAMAENKRYSFALNGSAHTITAVKTGVAITAASIFNGQDTQTITFDYGSGFFTSNPLIAVRHFKENIISVFDWNATSIANGAAFNWLDFDTTTGTFTKKSVTNNSSMTLYAADPSGYGFRAALTDTSVILMGSSRDVLKEISMTTGEVLATYNATQSTGVATACVRIAPGLYKYGKNIIDTVAQTCYPFNADLKEGTASDYELVEEIDALTEAKYRNDADDDSERGLYKNPLFLATVYNLERAVTKDSTQTMKVTYTLMGAS